MSSRYAEESLNKKIVPVLRALNTANSDMEASAVISRDGICLAAELRDGVDPDRLGAMCATFLGLADTAVKELERGTLQQVILYGTQGMLLLVQIGSYHVLALETPPTINVGMTVLNARKAADELALILPMPE